MFAQNKVEWGEMTPKEFRAILEQRPIAYVPLGLLEWHGDHLPLGTDYMKINGIILEIVKRTGGIVLPPTFYGRPGFGSFVGTLVFSEELIYQMLTELYTQLEKCGFKVIVVLTGHYGPIQVNLVKKTATDYMAHSQVKIIAQPEYEGIEPPPADHAGKWETAFSQALYPELVQMSEFQPGLCPIHKYDESWIAYESERRDWIWKEDLREASSAEMGAEMIQRIVEHIAAQVNSMLATALRDAEP